MKGKLCKQTLELTNHIIHPCSHDTVKTDELTYVYTGVILLVNLGHEVSLQCTLPMSGVSLLV